MKQLRRICALLLCLVLLGSVTGALAMVSDSLWNDLLYEDSYTSSGGSSGYVDDDLWGDLVNGGALDQEDYDSDWDYDFSYDGSYPAPEFPYFPLDCQPNQKIATRSGPSTKYTECGTYSSQTEVMVFYQAEGSGVPWGYIEFYYKSKLYRAYTGMKRLNVNRVVPADDETVYNYVTLAQDFKPYFGPGYEYATLSKTVKKGTSVPAFFTDNGWVMFDYTLSNGQIQRGWAPPNYWY